MKVADLTLDEFYTLVRGLIDDALIERLDRDEDQITAELLARIRHSIENDEASVPVEEAAARLGLEI